MFSCQHLQVVTHSPRKIIHNSCRVAPCALESDDKELPLVLKTDQVAVRDELERRTLTPALATYCTPTPHIIQKQRPEPNTSTSKSLYTTIATREASATHYTPQNIYNPPLTAHNKQRTPGSVHPRTLPAMVEKPSALHSTLQITECSHGLLSHSKNMTIHTTSAN